MNQQQRPDSIVIVDDTPQNLTVLAEMLSQHGYQVRPALDGELALKAIQKAPPDVILLDIMMPDLDGYEVCRRLKANPATADIPVIFISALNELDEKLKAFEAGGVDYITKPFQAAEVLLRVQTHVKMGAMQRQLREQNARLQHEIAERQRSEDTLRKLSRAVDHSASTIVITNTDGIIEFANPAFFKITGYTPEEVLGKSPNLLSSGKHSSEFYQDLWRTISQGDVWYGEFINKRKNGDLYWEFASISPVKDASGQITHYVAVKEDITERKRTEALLYELQKAVETTDVGITITDPEGNIIYINPADAAMHGYTVEELLGQRSNLFAPPELRLDDWFSQEATELEQVSNWKRERLNVRKDGSVFPVKLISNPIKDRQNDLIGNVIVCEDITERKRTEKIMRDQAILLRGVAGAMNRLLVNDDVPTSLMESLEVLGFATGVDRIYIYETHAHRETGEPAMSHRFTWAQDLPEVRINVAAHQNMPYHPTFSRWYERLSRNQIISGLIREFPPSERDALDRMGTLSTLVVPITIRHQFWGFIGFDNCQTERQWNEEEESILLAMAGSIGGAIARQYAESRLVTANTDLQAALDHLKHTQNQLILSEKMAALGQLVAGVAHEINTPLGAIRSSIETIATTLSQTIERLPAFLQMLPPEVRQHFFSLLQRARQRDVTLTIQEERNIKRRLAGQLETEHLTNTLKIAEILVNLGVYDQIEPLRPLLHAPNLMHILDMAYRLAGLQDSTRTILTATDRASTVVFALKTYARYDHSGAMSTANLIDGIETVLTLYHNQMKHEVEVIRDYAELPPIPCYPDELNQVWTNLIHNALHAMRNQGTLTIQAAQQDRHVVIAISDTGSGIPEAVAPRIFEPFFTTKPSGEGSGLGLDIVKKIIDKHQGTITFESRPGRTTFYVRLPMGGT